MPFVAARANSDPLALFHPPVREWFRQSFSAATRPQTLGWPAIARGESTLILSPTGSGKTLTAFLWCLDRAMFAPPPDPGRRCRVVYISPLKALSADIHKNLAIPRRDIAQRAQALGIDPPRITAAVRTGDTTSSERAAMIRTPPHILVTTPESLFLLLTSERSRQMLRTVRTVIVDEIHAVIGTRRGAHLALSLERLQEVAEWPLVRIGLSATQKPVDTVADFLVGRSARSAGGSTADCVIVDEGHRRTIDLALELPKSSPRSWATCPIPASGARRLRSTSTASALSGDI